MDELCSSNVLIHLEYWQIGCKVVPAFPYLIVYKCGCLCDDLPTRTNFSLDLNCLA